RQVGGRADRPDAREVEPVATAELQLQPAEAPPGGGLGAAGHVVRVAEPDRPRGRRPVAAQAEQAPDREPGQLALEVVERGVERGARGLLAGRPLDLVRRPGVVARVDGAEPPERRLRRLAVPGDRGRLAEAGELAVPQLDLDELDRLLRGARDHERLRERQSHDPSRQAHTARLGALAPVAQGIERVPPEHEVAGSIPAGRMLVCAVVRAPLRCLGRTRRVAAALGAVPTPVPTSTLRRRWQESASRSRRRPAPRRTSRHWSGPSASPRRDHLVVAPWGVFVIDAKNYKGRVEKRDRGGLFSTDYRLYVGGRDRTALIAGMTKQVDAVRKARGDEFANVQICKAICFVEADWPLFARPIELD